jgi:hypothetical protein
MSSLPITKSPFNRNGKFLCCYINATPQIQVLRITNIANCFWERVVFPGQRLLFEARKEARVEIHTPEKVTSILADVISCQQLQIAE